MKLQLALDVLQVEEAKAVLAEVADVVDIIEIGTPLLAQAGLQAVSEIKEIYPEVEVLADLKIIDAGKLSAQIAFEAGADLVTVLGLANDVTIQAVVDQARQYEKQVIVDLIAVADVQHRARALDALGVDYIRVHTGLDRQGQGGHPLEELQLVRVTPLQTAKLAVAGGIKPGTLPQVVAHQPDIVIVGGYITGHPDQRKAALAIKQGMNGRQPAKTLSQWLSELFMAPWLGRWVTAVTGLVPSSGINIGRKR
jgi:3-hexulose-6-phosphate synthase